MNPSIEQRKLAAILFTDMVGSTALKQQLGDKAGLQLMGEHHELLRQILRQFAGAEEIKTAGDSFFLSFPTPSAAVSFALLLQERLRQFNAGRGVLVQDRVGIHLGEVSLHVADDAPDLHGLHVDLCARVMGLAQGGQILMTRAVFDSARQTLKGEDLEGVAALRWVSHGRYLLKGLDEPVEICEVAESGQEALRPPDTTEKAQRHTSPEEEPVLGWRPAVGQQVGRTDWVLEEKLGEGGFGEVWVGRHRRLKERRVFKFCFRADRVRSLKREMTLFRLIKERIGDHPNIVSLREVYFDEPPYYVEMDYAEGQDLASWCAAQGGAEKVGLETKLEIVAQVAEALQAAHECGVIHRDVKPGNILVSNPKSEVRSPKEDREPKSEASPLVTRPSPLTVKLTDFGIGQVISGEYLADVTKAGFTQTMMSSGSSQTGTQLYLAPELMAGEPATTRSDLYSLGVVLYQLVVGAFNRPLTSDWAEDIGDPLLREDIRHCVAGKPADRFAGAAQLAKHLRDYAPRKAALERERAAGAERERLKQQAERRRSLAVVVAGIALVLVVIAMALGYGLRTAQAERDRQRSYAYAADMSLAQQALSQNNLGRALTLLDRYTNKPGVKDLRGWEWRYLWKQSRSDEQSLFDQTGDPTVSVAVSADGKWLAVGGYRTGRLLIRDLETRQPVEVLSAGQQAVRAAFSPRESLLAFGATTNYGSANQHFFVRLWDGKARRIIAELPLSGECAGLAFSEDGQSLATATGDMAMSDNPGQIALWSVPARTRLATHFVRQLNNGLPGWPFAASRDLRLAACVSQTIRGSTLSVLDLATGKILWTNVTPSLFITCAFSPDGKTLATSAGFAELVIRLWDVASGRELRSLEGHRGYVLSLLFWPDGTKLASASADQTIRVWDLTEGECLATFRGNRDEVWRLASLTNTAMLVSGCKDGSVRLWDTSTIGRDGAYTRLPPRLRTWCFAADSRSVLTVNLEGKVERWHGDNFQERQPLLEVSTNSAPSVLPFPAEHFSPDRRLLASASTNGIVQIWDLQRLAAVREIAVHTEAVLPVAFLSQGTKLVLLYPRDGSLHEWNLATGREAQSWPGVPKPSAVAFSPDERWCVMYGYDGPNLLRDMVTGRTNNPNLNLGMSGKTEHIVFSPDGRLFAAASYGSVAPLWETSTRRNVAELGRFLLGAHSVAFSPDGRRLAATSTGPETVKLWDVKSEQELLTLESQESRFVQGAFSPDGNALGALSREGYLHLWRAPSWEEIAAAEAKEKAESKQP